MSELSSTAAPHEEWGEPLSLYLDLAPGAAANLEVVAQASLDFVRALRDAAQFLDPNVDLRVELLSGTPGSLSLNALIRSLGTRAGLSRHHLVVLAIFMGGFFADHLADWTFEKVADALWEHHSPATFSPEEVEQITTACRGLQSNGAGQSHIHALYRDLESDPAIRGVGVSPKQDAKPRVIVPRAMFHEMAVPKLKLEEVEHTRTRTPQEIVTLVSPVLMPTSKRKWVVTSSEGTISVAMEDGDFMERLANGRLQTPLVSNLKLEVVLSLREVRRNGVWQSTGRSITKVVRIIRPQPTQDLFTRPSPNDESPVEEDTTEDKGEE